MPWPWWRVNIIAGGLGFSIPTARRLACMLSSGLQNKGHLVSSVVFLQLWASTRFSLARSCAVGHEDLVLHGDCFYH